MKRNKVVLLAVMVTLIALGSFAFITPSKTAPKATTNIAALKAVVQTAKDATKFDPDFVTLSQCNPVFVFIFIGTVGEEHNPAKYVYTGSSFDRNSESCPGVQTVCAIIVCGQWVITNPLTGVKTLKVGFSNTLDTAIDNSIAAGVEDTGVATDLLATYDIFLKDIQE